MRVVLRRLGAIVLHSRSGCNYLKQYLTSVEVITWRTLSCSVYVRLSTFVSLLSYNRLDNAPRTNEQRRPLPLFREGFIPSSYDWTQPWLVDQWAEDVSTKSWFVVCRPG